MSVVFSTPSVTLHQGDVRACLAELADESVDCVVTSPPYWGLRDYGVAGQIGLERTPPEFVEVMVDVFREVRRVLRPHGTLWLNLGDSYAQQGGPGWQGKNGQRAERRFTAVRDTVPMREIGRQAPSGLKPKDMVGIPWRVAFALQADGWYLRSDIIWAKPNPMPESVTDRPTKSHEYVFLLSKSERYFFDQEAVREPLTPSSISRLAQNVDAQQGSLRVPGKTNGAMKAVYRSGNKDRKLDAPSRLNTHMGSSVPWQDDGTGRNIRSVWNIATQPYPEAHFATFPRELARRCIQAGVPERVCSQCGRPRERETASSYTNPGNRRSNGRRDGQGFRETGVRVMSSGQRLEKQVTTTGWTDCGHGAYVPGIVLDPFAGSGTTLEVATALGRHSTGIEINSEYGRLIEQRCAQYALELGA